MAKIPGIIIFRNGISRGGSSYDGEKIPGDLQSMLTLSTDANDILKMTYGTLSKRSGTFYHTYGPARSAVNKLTDYAIGPGLVFRSQPDWSVIPGMDKSSAKDWGKDFQKLIHYYFDTFNYYEKQQVIFRGALTLGDSLQIFERKNGELTDIIEFAGDQIQWEYKDSNFTLGIKHDKYLRPTAIKKLDGKIIPLVNTAGDRNIIQYFHKEQPRQLRGYPLIYSIINLMKNDDRHWDATVQRAVMESIMIGSWETDQTNPVTQVQNQATANIKKSSKVGQLASNVLSKIANAFNLGAGNMYSLRKGEKLSFTDLKTPSTTFRDFKEVIVEFIGAATGVPPEVILSKYSTSYTAHRGALNDFKKTFMLRRKNFERDVLNPTIEEIAKDAILKGWISAPGFFENHRIRKAYLQGAYLGPVLGSINPLQEAKANESNVKNIFELRSDIAAQNGNEWDNFLEEWQEEQEEYIKKPQSYTEKIQGEKSGNTGVNTNENNIN